MLSSAAALLDSLFEQPAKSSPSLSLDSLSMAFDTSLGLIIRPQRLVRTYNIPVFRLLSSSGNQKNRRLS